MPKAGSGSRAAFAVSPWQTKKCESAQISSTSTRPEVYSEVFVPLGTAAGQEVAGEAERGIDKQGRCARFAPHQQSGSETGNDACSDRQQQSIVAHATSPTEQGGRVQHVPEICGFADIAVMKATTAGLIGHVRDSRGAVVVELHSEVLVQRQECTRDDDWSLHLLHLHLPDASPSSLSILAERTGEDAIRLRAPPAPHGSEDDVVATLARLGTSPAQGVQLQFDCESLWEANSPQARAIGAGLELEPNSIAAVNTGHLRLGPVPFDS